MEKRNETEERNKLWEKFGGTCLNIRNAADMLELDVDAIGLILDDAYSCQQKLKDDKDKEDLSELDLYNHVLEGLIISCREQVEKLLNASKKFREIIGDPHNPNNL